MGCYYPRALLRNADTGRPAHPWVGEWTSCIASVARRPNAQSDQRRMCARRTVGNFDGDNSSSGLGCLLAWEPPVAKPAVFLSSRSAPFNFVLASTFVGAKT